MHRMRRALAAVKMAEMARLGALLQQIDAEHAQANRLRAEARTGPVPETAADMLAQSQWQLGLEARARTAHARAAEIEASAQPLRQALARTLGQETVTADLIAQIAHRDDMRKERRLEDERPAKG